MPEAPITLSRHLPGRIHWIETASPRPDAQPVVLLHGLGGDAGFWSAELDALSRRYRVLAIDLRGSGATPGSSAPFSMHDLASDVMAVLDAAQLASAHVVGFSMGGLVAQALAMAAPQRVRGLVLAATFATTNFRARRFLEAIASVYRGGASERQVFELVLPWLFSTGFLGSPRAAPYLGYPQDAPDEQSREDWLRLLDAQLQFDGRAQLPRIRAATLVIGGTEDALAPAADAQALAAGIEGAVLKLLPAGHLMNVECPAEFIESIEAFFDGLGQARGES